MSEIEDNPDATDPENPVVPEIGDGDGDEEEAAEPQVDADPDQTEGVEASQREAELAAERQQHEQQQSRDVEDAEKKSKALDRASKLYIDKVVAALGADLDGWQMCPLCAEGYPGLRLPLMPSAENTAAVRVAIGLEPGDNLKPDNYSRKCDACDGWGYTDSGSHVPTQAKLQCIPCEGKGWVAVGSERENGNVLSITRNTSVQQPILQDNPSNDPPEVAALKQMGYVVVAPIPTPDAPPIAGV